MNTQEIANRLVDLCRKGDFTTVYSELYSPDCISLEPEGAMWPEARGMEEMRAKGEKWNATIEEMHSSEVSDPIVAGNRFTVAMCSDVSFKDGNRVNFDEICLYEVQEGKIVKEQFFYES